MRVDLDELIECDKCRIVFNYFICSEKTYKYDNTREGKYPLCNKEFIIEV